MGNGELSSELQFIIFLDVLNSPHMTNIYIGKFLNTNYSAMETISYLRRKLNLLL